jgi:hypothetical protein
MNKSLIKKLKYNYNNGQKYVLNKSINEININEINIYNYIIRVIQEDETIFAVTCDYIENRLNVVIKNNKIIECEWD